MLVLEFKAQPNRRQVKAIDEAIRTTQFVRNKVLRHWIDNPGLKLGQYGLHKHVTELRKQYPFVKILNVHACQAASDRAWLAIQRFYDNCKSGKLGKKGFPQFQKDCRSVEYKTSGWSIKEEDCFQNAKLFIEFTDGHGIGRIKLRGTWCLWYTHVPQIKRVRLVRRADGYYCQLVLDVSGDWSKTFPSTGEQIGLDVGLESFYTDSNGHHEPNPRFLRKAEKAIKHAQRRIYDKEKGSSNRRKARARFSRKHLRASRQRVEHAKRLARNLCKSNDLVAYEDLRIANMVKCHSRAKSISDASWYQFRMWIEYFAKKFGRTAIAVNPYNTSQQCCRCKELVPKTEKERVHSCCHCGLVLHRDINAAINILLLAITRDGQSRSNALGDGTATLFGATLIEQVLSLSKESPRL